MNVKIINNKIIEKVDKLYRKHNIFLKNNSILYPEEFNLRKNKIISYIF
jgi:hypothetical protein